MSKKLLNIIIPTLIINAASHLLIQIKWRLAGENGADLVLAQTPREDGVANRGVMIYLVAGCGNQPEQAFEFLMPDLVDYGVTYVNYRPDRGCDMRLIANQVVADIKQHNYQKVLVIGCSIGDYVGRVCEAELGDRVYTIAINPEPDSSLLKPWAKVATRVGVPIGILLTTAAGWVSQWQLYSDCENHFSFDFMVSQFGQIGFRHDAPKACDNLLGIIVAEPDVDDKGEDEFLQGREAMRAYFDNIVVYSAVGAGHGNTVKGASAYKEAWDKLWAVAKPAFESGI